MRRIANMSGSHRSRCSGEPSSTMLPIARPLCTPKKVANMAPKIICPWPPMLNRPERKEIAMPSEMMISGVERVSDSMNG